VGGLATHSRFIIWIDQRNKEANGEKEKVTFTVQDKEKEERETGTLLH
jgi:hypothetical protein